MKVLVVYGTRFGATASTSKEIANVLQEEGFDVRVTDAKKHKVKDITDYDLVIIGSGIKLGRWTKEPENFLKTFQKDLIKKKVALFVSSGLHATYEHEGNTEAMEKAWRDYLQEKAETYSLQPITMAIFGGVMDPDKMGFLEKNIFSPVRKKLEEAGFKEKDGVYDTRNWETIRIWAKKLVKKVID